MNTEPAPDENEEAMGEVELASVLAVENVPAGDQALPATDASSFQSLPWEALRLHRFLGGIFIGVTVLLCLIGVVVLWFIAPSTIEVWGGAAAGIALILGWAIWIGWIYPKAAHRSASWKISEHGLEIRRGVWWRHRIVIPHSRMQHSDIEQGPLQRMYSLATLVIHTAGTKNSSIQLENLNSESAEQLRDALTSGRWDMSASLDTTVTT
ncbi:PH domain-containing protein [Rhodopirellula sp. P2]|uniref:PH domain-containing protein n=1 Tax=Rhodopirellula sp. P2 TaxID=2127060 RepID=UPI002367C399|nr:PH domain-containing protein [Rhodopirellula sp. P2]WDQ14714.1 PH domain-containing protein [Rhodopirellula sp. P2]